MGVTAMLRDVYWNAPGWTIGHIAFSTVALVIARASVSLGGAIKVIRDDYTIEQCATRVHRQSLIGFGASKAAWRYGGLRSSRQGGAEEADGQPAQLGDRLGQQGLTLSSGQQQLGRQRTPTPTRCSDNRCHRAASSS